CAPVRGWGTSALRRPGRPFVQPMPQGERFEAVVQAIGIRAELAIQLFQPLLLAGRQPLEGFVAGPGTGWNAAEPEHDLPGRLEDPDAVHRTDLLQATPRRGIAFAAGIAEGGIETGGDHVARQQTGGEVQLLPGREPVIAVRRAVRTGAEAVPVDVPRIGFQARPVLAVLLAGASHRLPRAIGAGHALPVVALGRGGQDGNTAGVAGNLLHDPVL